MSEGGTEHVEKD